MLPNTNITRSKAQLSGNPDDLQAVAPHAAANSTPTYHCIQTSSLPSHNNTFAIGSLHNTISASTSAPHHQVPGLSMNTSAAPVEQQAHSPCAGQCSSPACGLATRPTTISTAIARGTRHRQRNQNPAARGAHTTSLSSACASNCLMISQAAQAACTHVRPLCKNQHCGRQSVPGWHRPGQEECGNS